ncbi:MAG: hypothetical protein EHM47_06875 [Ignavibacteriales bacterium]|nr:MAG: hypothetical protein EHM47_06875 [Ignavibacteriales bacterium]
MKYFVFIIFLLITIQGFSQSKLFVDGGVIISHFQQQIKQEVGDPRGERLIHENEFGFLLSGRYLFNEYISGGLFLRTDFGKREMALFDGFDPEGKTKVRNRIGGNYFELWFGPEIMLHWKQLFGEIGYGLIGIRDDAGRNDIPSNTGNLSGSFSTSPSIAWMFSLGAHIPIFEKLDVMLKIEYRLRYYNERNGEPLINEIDHGTMNISPIIGITFTP